MAVWPSDARPWVVGPAEDVARRLTAAEGPELAELYRRLMAHSEAAISDGDGDRAEALCDAADRLAELLSRTTAG